MHHLACVQARPAADQLARPAAHLRLASGDAGRAAQGGAGADGTTTIEMTMRYAHLSPDVRRDAVQLLDHATPWQRGWCPIQVAGVAVEKWWRREADE